MIMSLILLSKKLSENLWSGSWKIDTLDISLKKVKWVKAPGTSTTRTKSCSKISKTLLFGKTTLRSAKRKSPKKSEKNSS
jgi:hypothetical protein